MDLARYQGTGQFGRAYQAMMAHDPNPPWSVDRVLASRMLRLCAETALYLYRDYTPLEARYQHGSRPELERYAAQATAGSQTDEEKIAGIVRFCLTIQQGATEDVEEMLFGGTEEQLIARRTAWCTEIARVSCVMCQIAGLPARLVYLFDTGRAYSGHAVIEVYRRGAWGTVCAETDCVYVHADGRPASTWELQNDPDLIREHQSEGRRSYTTVGQFAAAAISNYFVRDQAQYQYPVIPINEYYRAVMKQSLRGWPGGLRWIHGEDQG